MIAVNPDERAGHWKGAENRVGRFAILECVNNAVERNAGTSDVIAAVALFDVVLHILPVQLTVYAV